VSATASRQMLYAALAVIRPVPVASPTMEHPVADSAIEIRSAIARLGAKQSQALRMSFIGRKILGADLVG
jgi:hypothetical protein